MLGVLSSSRSNEQAIEYSLLAICMHTVHAYSILYIYNLFKNIYRFEYWNFINDIIIIIKTII